MLPAADTFKAFFSKYTNAIVTLSGGADSACVLMLAAEFMGRENVLAATCINSQFFASEADNAKKIADAVGVAHVTFTAEMPKEFYAGGAEKCYHCKKAIMQELMHSNAFQVIFDGTNADDDINERMGFKAISELGVISPLLELGIGKADILDYVSGLPHITFRDESCKATRLTGEIDEFRMNQVERFEAQVKNTFPSLRFRIDDNKIELKQPKQVTKAELEFFARSYREFNQFL